MSVNQNKYHINLLQPELLPEKVLMTLSRVVSLWVLVLLLMVAWFGYGNFTQKQLAKELKILQQTELMQNEQLTQLTAQLNERKVSSHLVEKLEALQMLVENKKVLHGKLTNTEQTYVAGFAAAMDELSQLHRKDIRLQKIHLNNEDMTFTGLALTPEAVPAWLSGFENSVLLSGKSFSHFKLSENEQNITEFRVSSIALKESHNE